MQPGKQPTRMADPISGQGVGAAPKKQPYTLYAAHGRVYAQNVTHAIIDLGALARDGGGTYAYRLDGNELAGSGFATPDAALREIASRLHFLWLDGQFTALPDVRQGLDLSGAAKLEIALDELGPGERIEDATV
jgi:hypothetical protein